MGTPWKKGFRWHWLLEPPVLIAVFLPAAIVISRLWPQEPFMWPCLYAGGIGIGVRTGVWVASHIRPNSNMVEAPQLFTLFWLPIIFLELMWVLLG
jgi:hypothetical protein